MFSTSSRKLHRPTLQAVWAALVEGCWARPVRLERNALVVLQLDASLCNEHYKPIAMVANLARNCRWLGKLGSLGLCNVLSRDLRPGFYAPDVTRGARLEGTFDGRPHIITRSDRCVRRLQAIGTCRRPSQNSVAFWNLP